MERLADAGDHPVLTTVVIVAAVLVLVGLRAWTWVRKERVLRRVGLDLHVPEGGPEDGRTDRNTRHTGT